jgi:uncharacterized protein
LDKILFMINRIILESILKNLYKRKVILLFGARQTGKTTLLQNIAQSQENVLWLNGDEYDIQERFKNPTSTSLKSMIGNHKLVIIDEAQRIHDIGIGLKLIHDNYPDIQLIATGSSAFELKNRTNESLTGRKIEYFLYPISYEEMAINHSELIEKRLLNTRLVFGSYPEIINQNENPIDYLKSLIDSYLFKDILMLDAIKKPEKLVNLLQALAFQVGSEITYSEIGNLIGLDSKTVESYIDLLEKCFIIFKLKSLNRNLRNELKLSKKIYFYDNGVRNALISNFQILEGRQDIGALFENYIISERQKYNHYHFNYVNKFFWRTKEQQEIDYIEEQNGGFDVYEIKWNKSKLFIPKTFINAYENSTYKLINKDNYNEFLS